MLTLRQMRLEKLLNWQRWAEDKLSKPVEKGINQPLRRGQGKEQESKKKAKFTATLARVDFLSKLEYCTKECRSASIIQKKKLAKLNEAKLYELFPELMSATTKLGGWACQLLDQAIAANEVWKFEPSFLRDLKFLGEDDSESDSSWDFNST